MGSIVGSCEGVLVGSGVGAIGRDVGSNVGSKRGLLLGSKVGSGVGLIVGSNDGALVGSAAGYGVGLVVGGKVGGQGSFKYTEVALEISSSSGFFIDKNRLTAAIVPSELSRH